MITSLRLTVVCLGVLLLQGEDEAPWKEFSSTQYEFKAIFPGDPEEKTLQQEKAVLHIFASRQPVDNLAFILQCAEVESAPLIRSKEGERKSLDGFVKGYAQAGKVDLQSERDMTVSGAAGRELLATTPNGQVLLTRVCNAKGRMYSLTVTGANSEAMKSPLVAKFLDSFQLLNYTPPDLPEKDRENDLAENLGRLLGQLICVGVIVWVIVALSRKAARRKAEPGSESASGQPG